MGYKDNRKQIEYMREWRKRQPKKRVAGGGTPNYIATNQAPICRNCRKCIDVEIPSPPEQPEIPLPSSDTDDSSVEPDDSSVEPDDSSVARLPMGAFATEEEPDDSSVEPDYRPSISHIYPMDSIEEQNIAKIPKRYLQTPAGSIRRLIKEKRKKIDVWSFVKMKTLALKSVNENTNQHAHNCFLLYLLHECTGK